MPWSISEWLGSIEINLDDTTVADLKVKLSNLAITPESATAKNIPKPSNTIPASFAQEQVTGVDEDLRRPNVLERAAATIGCSAYGSATQSTRCFESHAFGTRRSSIF